MPDPLERLGVYSLVCQIIVGNLVLLHILPHRRKRNRHIITPGIIIWGLILDIIVTIIMLMEVSL